MSKPLCLSLLVFVSGVFATELPEKFANRIATIEATYRTAVQKADSTRLVAIQKANQERNKALKSALSDATKAGDFDSAVAIKAKLASEDLATTISGTEWQAGPDSGWGRFRFNADGGLNVELSKGNRRWYPIDEDSVLMTGLVDSKFAVSRFVFSKDRTSATIYYLGLQNGPQWDAKKIDAK